MLFLYGEKLCVGLLIFICHFQPQLRFMPSDVYFHIMAKSDQHYKKGTTGD